MGALCAETHEAWLESSLDMDLLREQHKEQLRKASHAVTAYLHNLTTRLLWARHCCCASAAAYESA